MKCWQLKCWPYLHAGMHVLRTPALSLILIGSAHAHLMVAQKGTLNIFEDGAFMVLSLPVSAFKGVDDNGDGLLSIIELRSHAADIDAQIQTQVQLISPAGPLPLQGLLLNLSPPDDSPSAPAKQLVVMGRFALGGIRHDLRFRLGLFGQAADERRVDITMTQKPRSQLASFEPGHSEHAVLPVAWTLFKNHLREGAEHVLGGLDHVLFLLLVLATGWGWR